MNNYDKQLYNHLDDNQKQELKDADVLPDKMLADYK